MPRTTTSPAPKTEEPAAPAIINNVYYKLLTARKLFLEEAIRKTGKANKLGYKYFELDDIVPVAIQIFYDLPLLPHVSFTELEATMTIINCDNPEDTVTFTSPMAKDTGGLISNEIQKLGSVQTYLRRYLYMMALDIVEADQVEATAGVSKPAAPAVQSAVSTPPITAHAPDTPEKREEIRKDLTRPDENADELMLNALKEAVKKLRQAGNHDEECVKYALETKGFTQVTKVRCAAIIAEISKKMGADKHE